VTFYTDFTWEGASGGGGVPEEHSQYQVGKIGLRNFGMQSKFSVFKIARDR